MSGPEIDIYVDSSEVSDSGSVNFGSITGTGTTQKTFTIKNTGSATLTLNGSPVDITGPDLSYFSISGSQPNKTISAGSQDDFIVVFNPPDSGNGTANAVITISHNDTTGDEEPYNINLSGSWNETASEIIFKDTFNVSGSGDVNYNYNEAGRQSGLVAPLTYNWANGPVTVTNEGSHAGKAHMDATSIASYLNPSYNFTNSGNFSIEFDLTRFLSATTTEWVTCSFGTDGAWKFPHESPESLGMEVMFYQHGWYQVYIPGTIPANIVGNFYFPELHILSNQTLNVKIIVSQIGFPPTSDAKIAMFINDTPYPLVNSELSLIYSYIGGFTNNYINFITLHSSVADIDNLTVCSLSPQPATPVEVSATDGTYCDKIRITWAEIINATKYKVYRNTENNSGSSIDISGELTTTIFDDTSVVTNQLYYYWVKAGNSEGWSDFSDSDSGYINDFLFTSEWTRIWGSTAYDRGLEVCVDNSDYIYVTGETSGSFDGQTNYGNTDLCLTKYDLYGNKQWTRIWGSDSYDIGVGVCNDNTGNIYVTGWTWGAFDGQTNNGAVDLCLTKFDGSGNKLWTRIWGTKDWEIGFETEVDSAGNVYVAGYTTGNPDGQTNYGTNDFCLVKFDSNGNRQWTRVWGSINLEGRPAISIYNNYIYVSGFTFGSFDGQSNNGEQDFCLSKFDNNGNKLWTRIWGSAFIERGNNVNVDNVGNVYVSGLTFGSFDGQINNGDSDLCLTKFDSNGSKKWTRIWGSVTYDSGCCLNCDNFGNIYVAGDTQGSFDGQINNGNNDFCLTKFDTDGNRKWSKIWGSPAYDRGAGVCLDNYGDIYVSGNTYGSFNGQINNGDSDLCLIKFDNSSLTSDFGISITTNPKTVSNNVTTYSIVGTSSNIVGSMWVSNAANNEVHLFPAATSWTAPAVNLEIGTNTIYTFGKNAADEMSSDSVNIIRLNNNCASGYGAYPGRYIQYGRPLQCR